MAAVEANGSPDITLAEFLSRRARGASDARLVVDAVVGFVVAVAALLSRGPAWHLFASAGICFLSFGAWGIADRELSERGPAAASARALLGARVISAVVGFIAVVFLVIGALGIAIGRVIS